MNSTDNRPWYRRWKWRTLLIRGGLVAILLLTAVATWVHLRIRGSLALLDGTVHVGGIHDLVTVARDDMGVPTITATSRADAAFALGFLHAQDRFFQMDLLRRVSSGRLCELFGEAALDTDAQMRRHRFRATAKRVLQNMPDDHQRILTAYSTGVNAGIEQLGAPPFEYLALRTRPSTWQNEDSLFVVMSMLCDLQRPHVTDELGFGLLHERVPEEVFQFLVHVGCQWDSALDGSTLKPPEVPPADVFSLRDEPAADQAASVPVDRPRPDAFLAGWRSPELRAGSNNWAVASELGKDGRALLASDMHLGLSVPATWYRAVIHTPEIDGTTRRLVGVTLPGVCALVEGSNGSIAWGLTNSSGDFGEIIELNQPSPDSMEYETADGRQTLERIVEQVPIAGGTVKQIEYEWSIWGPVVDVRDGRRFVYRWVGHDAEAFNMNALALETAATVESAMEIANRCGGPQLNFVVADDQGNIGWTIYGRLPRRTAAPSIIPVDWSNGDGVWNGYLDSSEYPHIVNPDNGRIWTANNRIVGGDALRLIGDGRYDEGARASRIAQCLMAADKFDEPAMLAIQLDDRAILMQRWQQLLIETLGLTKGTVTDEFAAAAEKWDGHAAADSVGYRVVREFRWQVMDQLFGTEVSWRKASAVGALVSRTGIEQFLSLSYEDTMWSLIESRPAHWLPLRFASWDELLVEAARRTESTLTATGSLAEATWGSVNTIEVQHPISRVVPMVSGWLDMPRVSLPGDAHMPRVQGRTFGASERMVVSPGHEEEGLYHQPGGQSGHPYSPYYRAGFDDWAQGNPSPLMPGPTKHTLTLQPSS